MIHNIELYEFFRETECHIQRIDGEIDAWACINHFEIAEFCKVLGSNFLDDGGFDVKLKDGYIAVNMIEILEYFDEDIRFFKACFEELEWENNTQFDGKMKIIRK